MSIPPIPAALGIVGAGAVAGQALGAATEMFSNLLKGALPGEKSSRGETSPAKDSPPHANSLSRPGRAANEQTLRQELNGLLSQFHARLKEILEDRGIVPQGALNIQADPFGQMQVDASHPQSVEISNLLHVSSELETLFHEIGAKAGLLRAMEEADAFQQAYREDPEAAVSQFSHLFEREGDAFARPRTTLQVTVDDSGGTADFVPVIAR